MSGIGQVLPLAVNANGSGTGPALRTDHAQWFGGRARILVSTSVLTTVSLEVSLDGDRWVKAGAFIEVSSNGSYFSGLGDFDQPALLVRAVTTSNSTSQNLNVTLVGYDG